MVGLLAQKPPSTNNITEVIMLESTFEKYILELQEEYTWGRHHDYYREIIANFNPWKKLWWRIHLANYDRKVRNIQQIKLV